MAQNGVASHCFGVWVQLYHDSQILQRVLFQDSAVNLLPGKKRDVSFPSQLTACQTFLKSHLRDHNS